MSGKRTARERVEIQVAGGKIQDYFGVYFLNQHGDYFTRGTENGYSTQFIGGDFLRGGRDQVYPPTIGEWTTVRAVTSEDRTGSDWMQTYVFDLTPFIDHFIKIRIVDDDSISDDAYINADDFRFVDAAPTDTQWLPLFFPGGQQCGGVAGTGVGCSPVGHVFSQPPLWGVTDAHAHPMANLAFGGHVVWGDVSDSLQSVYDCSFGLPEIPGPGGRPRIKAPIRESTCYIAGDIAAIVTAAAVSGCAPLNFIPFVGAGLSSICLGAVAAANAILQTTPIVTGLTVHGGSKFSSGAVQFGGLFRNAIIDFADIIGSPIEDSHKFMFAAGIIPTFDSWPNASARRVFHWYPSDEPWHSVTGLGKTHNHYQAEMIRRAHAGGLRLAVWDVVNSRAFATITDGYAYASDWRALKDQTDAAKRIVSNNLADIAEIAYSPDDADRIIRSGKLAIVLGSEVDELGRMRPDGLPWPRSPRTAGDSVQKQVDDLWDLGIRKVSPVHAVNNPIGAAGIFVKDYVANNRFLNATPIDGELGYFDALPVRFILDRDAFSLPFRIILGKFSIFQYLGGDGKQPWNKEGWFELQSDLSVIIDPFIQQIDLITYRIGEDSPPEFSFDGIERPIPRMDDGFGNWLPAERILGKQIMIARQLADFSTFIRPSGRCDIYQTAFPDHATDFGPVVNDQYVKVDGHRNALGLYTEGDNNGRNFLRSMMKRGMVVDVDHMSQRMRVDVYQLNGEYAREAGWHPNVICAPNHSCNDYPVMGVHSSIRELEKEGSKLPHLIDRFGSNNETTRTATELSYVAANMGTAGVFPRPTLIPPNTVDGQCTKDTDCAAWNGTNTACSIEGRCLPRAISSLYRRNFALPAEVENDCDGSSKTFAVKYLWMMRVMEGKGLTLATDFNGLNGTQYPRFGVSIPDKAGCGLNARGDSLRDGVNWPLAMREWQKLEHSGIWYKDYDARSPVPSPIISWPDQFNMPPEKRWREVVARRQEELREDSSPRFTSFSNGMPINDKVYYNNIGRNWRYVNWEQQDSNAKGAQLFPMERWKVMQSGWDFNLDGFQHIGLLPDLMQDMRNVGVQWEQMGPLLNGASDFVSMWRRATDIGNAHP